MHALFHLGSTPALSLAELRAVVPGFEPIHVSRSWCLASVPALPDIDLLGGTVRIADALEAQTVSPADLERTIVRLLTAEKHDGRVEFGLSVLDGELALRQVGMRVKEALQELGLKARFASAGHRELATVLVRKSKVREVVLVRTGGRWLVARTVAIQNADAYTLRDTVKPARNLTRGMLPPKLAQVMLNLASPPADSAVLDPFCGTGTVLLEAIVQGRHRSGQVRGSDLDPEAVVESQRNLAWFSAIRREEFPASWVTQADAAQLPPVERLGAVVTEGTLGPLLSGVPAAAQLARTWEDLGRVYEPLFAWAGRTLVPDGRLVLTLPVFHVGTKREAFPTERFARLLPPTLAVEPLLPEDLARSVGAQLTDRGGLVADRPDQYVGREVVRLVRV